MIVRGIHTGNGFEYALYDADNNIIAISIKLEDLNNIKLKLIEENKS